MPKICGHKSLQRIVHNGIIGNRSAIGCGNTKSSLKSCMSSDLCSNGSHRQDNRNACRMGGRSVLPDLNTSTSWMSKSSKGAVCSSPQLPTLGTTFASKEDVQLSPRMAIRAAELKSRFAGIILKAQQQSLPKHAGKVDWVKMQQEKERLERLQHEEKAKTEARIRSTHEAASQMKAELQVQREREREAARLALQKMAKTVVFEDNIQTLKDFEILIGARRPVT